MIEIMHHSGESGHSSFANLPPPKFGGIATSMLKFTINAKIRGFCKFVIFYSPKIGQNSERRCQTLMTCTAHTSGNAKQFQFAAYEANQKHCI